MIMSERVVRMLSYDYDVTTNRLWIVFNAEGIVRADIADLFLGSARDCVAPNR